MIDEEIKLYAIEFAKRNKIRIAKELTDPAKYVPDTHPISVFMAGSPGAGKTEFSKSLIKILGDEVHQVIRIDADEIRSLIPGYAGDNSYLFQGAVSLIVEKIHDLALHQKQSFIFDSTFSRYEKSVDNIKRSLDKGRVVWVFYIYQKPEVAWRFTQAREVIERRNIPKGAFIEQFLAARETVSRISGEFGDKITIFFVKKNFEKNTVEEIARIKPNKTHIDDYIEKRYTKEELQQCL